MKSLNIYIHIPFCFAKCPYCAFFSCTQADSLYKEYFKRLEREICERSQEYSNREVTTIYIGGGTPNLVQERYIKNVVKRISEEFNVAKNAEISIELYPQYITQMQLQAYKDAGINRLSIGLQSADDQDLKVLSRRYTYDIFLEKYDTAKECGFKNIGIDLIFGYPTHTLEKWKDTLETVTKLDVQHISAYSLEVEEGTPYAQMYTDGSLGIPSDEVNREMYHMACRYLDRNGFKQYEISNFARTGYECKHNLNFWKYQDYLGLGAGAYSRIGDKKFNNPDDIHQYINGEGLVVEYIDKDTIEKEKKILGLRLNTGITNQRNIFDPEYMVKRGENISLNEKGKDLYNTVVEKLL